jgi:DNA-directed RNA polymerase subunit RPC12/RpoP
LNVKCVGCSKKFNVYPENFDNYETVFCPTCGLDHKIIKKTSSIIVKSIQCA